MREPHQVRIFPDYAGTVLWCPHPVDYADTALAPELIDQLRAWEDSYYAGLDESYAWRDAAEHSSFRSEGRKLARLVADALGDEFTVQIDDEVLRSRHPARCPAAAAALRKIADAEKNELDRIRRLTAGGSQLEWRA